MLIITALSDQNNVTVAEKLILAPNARMRFKTYQPKKRAVGDDSPIRAVIPPPPQPIPVVAVNRTRLVHAFGESGSNANETIQILLQQSLRLQQNMRTAIDELQLMHSVIEKLQKNENKNY